ncbi:hypothetical protein IFR05_007224 [Cadophora sp. M221]|nr:hypothetical protein IFR05_007224 [Cadophora sp. M221]
MPPPNITTHLATEDDALSLASIMTVAFSASDAAYPLIWGSAAEGTHDTISIIGLFTPVQKPERVTYKAFDEKTQKVVGFATWTLPKGKLEGEEREGEIKKIDEGGLPRLPGVNVDLWMEKVGGTRAFAERDVDAEKDMGKLTFVYFSVLVWKWVSIYVNLGLIGDFMVYIFDGNTVDLSFCFVHPHYQRQGIASSLLAVGLREADARKARFWCTSTPQAVSAYEKIGWGVVETHRVDLGKYGGDGIYTRAWMVREPRRD